VEEIPRRNTGAMKRIAAALVVVLFAACGGDNDGPCASRDGLYRVTLVAQSGNCGTISDIVLNANMAPSNMSCTGGSTPSADMCSATVDTTCAVEGGSVTMRGRVTWNRTGSLGTGTVYFDVVDRAGGCHGVYSATYRKI